MPPRAAQLPTDTVAGRRVGRNAGGRGRTPKGEGRGGRRGKKCRQERHTSPPTPSRAAEWKKMPPPAEPPPSPAAVDVRHSPPAQPPPSPAAVDVRPATNRR